MQHSLFDLLSPPRAAPPVGTQPATPKQLQFAKQIAARTKADLPAELQGDRQRLSQWIDTHYKRAPQTQFSNYPSSKQVAFAERIARIKRRQVPHECFRDKGLMSKWIDSNR